MKKLADSKMTFVRRSNFPDLPNAENPRANFIPVYEQSVYKYILYVEGYACV